MSGDLRRAAIFVAAVVVLHVGCTGRAGGGDSWIFVDGRSEKPGPNDTEQGGGDDTADTKKTSCGNLPGVPLEPMGGQRVWEYDRPKECVPESAEFRIESPPEGSGSDSKADSGGEGELQVLWSKNLGSITLEGAQFRAARGVAIRRTSGGFPAFVATAALGPPSKPSVEDREITYVGAAAYAIGVRSGEVRFKYLRRTELQGTDAYARDIPPPLTLGNRIHSLFAYGDVGYRVVRDERVSVPSLQLEYSYRANGGLDDWSADPFISVPDRPLVDDLLVLPDGRLALVWGGRELVVFTKGEDDYGHPTLEMRQMLAIDDIWPKAPDGSRLVWIRQPAVGELVAMIRTPKPRGDRGVTDHVFRVDRCGDAEKAFAARALADEIVRDPSGTYLARAGNCEHPDGPSKPRLFDENGLTATLPERCVDVVEVSHRQFFCLGRRPEEGYELIGFDSAFRSPSPTRVDFGDVDVTHARLQLLADGGVPLVLGLYEAGDKTRGRLTFIDRDEVRHFDLPPVDGFSPSPEDVRPEKTVLTSDGVLGLLWGPTLFAIQTPYAGLAHTRFPRPALGGNRNHGIVATSP